LFLPKELRYWAQARDENTRATFLKPVLNLFHRQAQEIYNVKIGTPDVSVR